MCYWKIMQVYNTRKKDIADFPWSNSIFLKAKLRIKNKFISRLFHKITHLRYQASIFITIVDGSIVIIKISIWSGHAFVNCNIN